MTMKRRDALKTIGGLATAAGMAKFLPGCGGSSGETGITTYVYLMMENRTYDHVLGARALMGLPGDGLKPTFTQPDLGGTQRALYIPDDLAICAAHDPPHGWDASHEQFNGGAMDGFLRVHQAEAPGQLDAIQYLTRPQQPVSWALADNYTTCDRWFCSVMGPTLPNRAYWHAATSIGLKGNNEVLDAFSSGIPVPSIYNRLADKGVDWVYYHGNLPVVSLLGNPGPYAIDLGPTDGKTGHVRRFGDALESVGPFFDDAKAGKLPPVVYIDPAFGENDDHPPVHPVLGQELIHSIYTALANSPQWNNIMLVITYDEHGGFYDHVAPPQTTDERAEFRQLGFRVPTIVAGPYVKKNYVSSVQYDHTSALKQLQQHFKLDPLNERMNTANDLMDCIDLERLAAGEPADPVTIPKVDRYAHPTTDPRCVGSGFRTTPGEITDTAWVAKMLKLKFPDS
ncbi:MAG: alkaline phosphatase family protein [Myxococcota bacterium]|nr:alkaline phosphatase family protein [Myxococcota bacterium]